jgi:acetyl-CoA carboxylase biotin carboxyl carrier protein
VRGETRKDGAAAPDAPQAFSEMDDPKFIDEAAIRALAAILREADLTEIEVVHGTSKLRVARQVAAAAVMMPGAAPQVAARDGPAAASGGGPRSVEGAVLSPMVGTAYRAPEPGARPFVEIGDHVRPGQVVMIIEAMKTMNQILAEREGTVREIFVEDGQPVEFGEPLLAVV